MNKYHDIELFHWAGMLSDNVEEVEKILVAHPEYINSVNRYDDNCLFIAIRSGNFNIVKYLVSKTDIDINYQNKDGLGIPNENALMCAIHNRKLNIAEFLIETPNVNLLLKNSEGKNIYHMLAYNGYAELIEKVNEITGLNGMLELDNMGRHCLYDCIDNFTTTKDLWTFDMLLELMPNEVLLGHDTKGLTLLNYIENKQEDNPFVRKDYEPLAHLIRSRLNFS